MYHFVSFHLTKYISLFLYSRRQGLQLLYAVLFFCYVSVHEEWHTAMFTSASLEVQNIHGAFKICEWRSYTNSEIVFGRREREREREHECVWRIRNRRFTALLKILRQENLHVMEMWNSWHLHRVTQTQRDGTNFLRFRKNNFSTNFWLGLNYLVLNRKIEILFRTDIQIDSNFILIWIILEATIFYLFEIIIRLACDISQI